MYAYKIILRDTRKKFKSKGSTKNQDKKTNRNLIKKEEPGQSKILEWFPSRDDPRQSTRISERHLDTRIFDSHPNRSKEMSNKKQKGHTPTYTYYSQPETVINNTFRVDK